MLSTLRSSKSNSSKSNSGNSNISFPNGGDSLAALILEDSNIRKSNGIFFRINLTPSAQTLHSRERGRGLSG